MKINTKIRFKKLLIMGLVVIGMGFFGVKSCWAQPVNSCAECPPDMDCITTEQGTHVCTNRSGIKIGEAFKLNNNRGIEDTTGYSDLGTFVTTSIVPNVMMVANLILFVMILGSGFVIISNAGNAEKQKQASQTLTASILGFVIIFAAYWIMQILGIITTGEASGLLQSNP